MAEAPHISTTARKQVVDLTDQVEAVIRKAKMQEGLCALFITHITAALTTGEVGERTEQDFLQVVEEIIPRMAKFATRLFPDKSQERKVGGGEQR